MPLEAIAKRGHPSHMKSMTERATKRPATFQKPAHWNDTPPPKPAAAPDNQDDPDGLSPTRYGDWVNKGIAIDF